MTKEILIYGLAPNETRDYMEELLSTQCTNDAQVQELIAKATKAGYHSFRVTSYNGEAPDFTKTLNI